MPSNNSFESLPVELIADILSELDLTSLVTVSYLSHRLRAVASEPSLNPWRPPILRTLLSQEGNYDPCLKHLSVRSIVPRQNFVGVLSLARAHYLLFEASLPNLSEREWEECFRRRFLPGWTKVRKDSSWRTAFLKVLHRVWHRTNTSCTSDEAWTKYIVLNRNGTANLLEGVSRGYNPLTIFEQMRLQNNLIQFQPSIRVLVEFADVRVLAIGVLDTNQFFANSNAQAILHPPGIEKVEDPDIPDIDALTPDGCGQSSEDRVIQTPDHVSGVRNRGLRDSYRRLTHPLPVQSHENYPFYTPSDEDKRWLGSGELEENGMHWVGSMMLTAQLIGPHTKETIEDRLPLQDLDLVNGPGRNQYASLTFVDLTAIAPWLDITMQIEGPGLGH
ncbi:hypothetical protein AcW1_004946 [Taiwanofungus camphoratus]|nr:hypothetical protein AcV5_001330 [Antrodia cinnamomea]KAI0941309.1 hypothetical protein AcV7_002914 [Antrodia cinnamomea]KAI0960428.1 hypothetical protein AcW1_004946 [Antrodia cinnamomea]